MNKIKKLAALPVAAAAIAIAMLGASPASAATASITVSPSSGVTIGQSVTVTGAGFPAGPVFMVECSSQSASACDHAGVGTGTADASGAFTAQFKVNASKCSAGSTCYILATTASQSPAAFGSFTIAGGTPSTTPTTGGTSSAPVAVNAGSGGHAGEGGGVPTGVVLLAGAGILGLGLGAKRFARR